MKIYFTILISLLSFNLKSQGVSLNTDQATQGYTLFDNAEGVYLVDNCGEIINNWSVYNPTLHAKLLPNGNLIYIQNGEIYEQTWQKTIAKRIKITGFDGNITYEVIKMKKGNYLCVARRPTSLSEMQSYGYNVPNTFPELMDMVIEVDPTGKVVWKWDLMDHVIQDVNASKKAYGILKDNPGKININAIATFDWTYTESFMINSFDYNEELDQIIISIRKIGEIAIIDHSTTTEEAKTSEGGKYGKGGDLLYRYGNPANYGHGNSSNHQLYFQHNPNWIQHGEHKGKIIVFNNLLSKETYSTVQIINPPINPDGSYKLDTGKPYEPTTPLVEYGKTSNKVKFWSDYTSGAKVLPNGNIAITEGRTGKLQEIKPDGTVVWSYLIPYKSGYVYRTEKYDANFEGFIGKTLIPGNTVEFPSSPYNCKLFTSTKEYGTEAFPLEITASNGKLYITSDSAFAVNIIDVMGRNLYKSESEDGSLFWQHSLSTQTVFVQIKMGDKVWVKKVLIY